MKYPVSSSKKLKRTKTMEATLKEASDYLNYVKFTSVSTKPKKVSPPSPPKSKTSKKVKKTSSNPRGRPSKTSLKNSAATPIQPQNLQILPVSQPVNQAPLQKTSSNIGLPGGPVAGMIDIVFCCDTTASMGSYLAKTKETIEQIIEKIRAKVKEECIDLKFGFVAYRDHPPQDSTYVFEMKDLCEEREIKEFIAKLGVSGGGDGPEAVMDGLWQSATSISWRKPLGTPTLRYIIHIADAPPHGDLYGGCSTSWKSGCPCGITIEKIAHVINMREIHYRLVKIGSEVEKMAEIFKGKIIDFLDIPLNEAATLDVKVSDMIIRELLPEDPEALKV